MQANLGLMFERKAKISCRQSVSKKLGARQHCMRASRKTDFRQKNEACSRLKISFVDLIYPRQRPEPPSLSRHFLLVHGLTTSVLKVTQTRLRDEFESKG